ncbi:Hypothetical protein GLP15_240 [Giardia lamblia P15]|uniref:Uncharacterized protein n=1 Tax=Giardia intestinalis (strain P15) TaxID=658858 RepID=E1F1L1_GIAIA|nr:Hypothetical protein GLP15_240 [Giardia lamblia P15]
MSYKRGRGNARHGQKQSSQASSDISAKDAKAINTIYTDFDNGKYVECFTTCNDLIARLPSNPDIMAMKGAATYYLPISHASGIFSSEEIGSLSIPIFLRSEGWRLINEAIDVAEKGSKSYIPFHIASIIKRHEHLEASAIECLQKASALSPSNSLFYKELSILYLHTGDYKKCEQSLLSFISTASSTKTSQASRIFAFTSFLCNMIQKRLDAAEASSVEFKSILQKAAAGAISQGGSAHRDASLYRNFYFDYIQALQAEHCVLALKAESGEKSNVKAFHRQLEEFPMQLKKTRSTKRYDREELLRQSLTVYKTCEDMYLLTLRRLYCYTPFDLFVYEKIFELYLEKLHGITCVVNLTGRAEGDCALAGANEYAILYSAYSQFIAGTIGCSCNTRPLPACFFHLLDPIQKIKQGRHISRNSFFDRTLCIQLAFMSSDYAAFKSEIHTVLSSKRISPGLLHYISKLVNQLKKDAASQLYEDLIGGSYPAQNSAYISAYFSYASAQLDPGDDDCNLLRCRDTLEEVLLPCTHTEDTRLPLVDSTRQLCVCKSYLNGNASQEQIDAFREEYTQELTDRLTVLRFKNPKELVATHLNPDIFTLYAKMLHILGLPHSAAIMSEIVSIIDNSDRSASRVAVDMHMQVNAIHEAYVMYGKFIYQADPWLVCQDTQDVSVLGLMYRDYQDPDSITRLVDPFVKGDTDAEPSSSSIEVLVVRLKAALTTIELTFDSYYELLDFHHYAVRVGYLITYWKALLDYQRRLMTQASTREALSFVLELVLHILKLDDERMKRFSDAMLSCEEGLTEKYRKSVIFYHELSKEKKDSEVEKNDPEEQPEALCDKDPYSIRAFLNFIADLRSAEPEKCGDYASSMLGHKLWFLIEKLPKQLVTSGNSLNKRFHALQNMLGGRVLLALKDLKDVSPEIVADVATVAHCGLARTPVALRQASNAALSKFLTEAASRASQTTALIIHRAAKQVARTGSTLLQDQ